MSRLITPGGIQYSTAETHGITSVDVFDRDDEICASKWVRPRQAGGWLSLGGQTFASLDAVADSMGWAVK